MPANSTRGWWLVAGLGAGFGLLCEYWAATSVIGWGQPGSWLPDLLTGWVLLACAVGVGTRRAVRTDGRGSGVLQLAAGLAWFAGTAWPAAQFWHRSILL